MYEDERTAVVPALPDCVGLDSLTNVQGCVRLVAGLFQMPVGGRG